MKLDQIHNGNNLVRAEVPLVGPDERQWKVILLDADDTFDVVIQDPAGDREAIWSLVKDGEWAGVTSTDRGRHPTCDECESEDIYYDPADGWTCRTCGATDADE